MAAFKNWNLRDFSATGLNRVIILTILGTLCSIALALAIDSSPLFNSEWTLGGPNPISDVIAPGLIAPPFFYYLLSKLRQLAILRDQLMVVASTDGLTSCLTRAAFTTMIDAYLDRVAEQEARREGALLVIDVDHFKLVNDSFGHDHGDAALRMIVAAVKTTLRDVDLVGRMGGEEFGVFIPGLPPDLVGMMAERMRAAVKTAKFCPNGIRYDLSISVGAATFSSETSFSELYKVADLRLYDAKRNGRDRVEVSGIAAARHRSAVH